MYCNFFYFQTIILLHLISVHNYSQKLNPSCIDRLSRVLLQASIVWSPLILLFFLQTSFILWKCRLYTNIFLPCTSWCTVTFLSCNFAAIFLISHYNFCSFYEVIKSQSKITSFSSVGLFTSFLGFLKFFLKQNLFFFSTTREFWSGSVLF